MKLLVLALFVTLVTAKIIMDIHDEVYECDSTAPLAAINISEIEFNFTDDDTLTLSGPIYALADLYSPVEVNFRSERFERGDWHTGILSRHIEDFCAQIKNRFELWYSITSKMEQQECPYKKGHVERFDNVEIGTFGTVIPPHFVGEWKFYFEITTTRNGQTIKECMMRRVNFVEA